jgi:hypothetical protein
MLPSIACGLCRIQQARELCHDIFKLLMWRKTPLLCVKYPSLKHWLPYLDVLIHLRPQRRLCNNKGFAVSARLHTCNNMLYAALSGVRGWGAIDGFDGEVRHRLIWIVAC